MFSRLLKRLRRKNRKQIQVERKEQGFSLYVNGANAERDFPVITTTDSDKSSGKPRLPKTAGGGYF